MNRIYLQSGPDYIKFNGRETTRAILSSAKRLSYNDSPAIIWQETDTPDIYERMGRDFTHTDSIEPGETYLYVQGVRFLLSLRPTGEKRYLNCDRFYNQEEQKMTEQEKQEMEELQLLWACQQATRKQVLRCMELERKAKKSA